MSNKYMDLAIREAASGITLGDGGPFGSVIVKDGMVVGSGHNRVIVNKDPTCHGEMEAIRCACKNLGTHDLSGCELYTTAEPCPMCLGAIMWANIKKVYYGCTRLDTAQLGFRDDDFYKHINGEIKVIDLSECDRENCLEVFKDYKAKSDKKQY